MAKRSLRPIIIPDSKPSAPDALAAAGFDYAQIDGAHVVFATAAEKTAAQALVDAYDPLPAARERAIGLIKAEAGRRILERFPQWKQANMTARGVELLAIGLGGLSDDQVAETVALRADWAWIAAVRARSNEIEAEVNAMDDAMAINAIDPAVAAWPA